MGGKEKFILKTASVKLKKRLIIESHKSSIAITRSRTAVSFI